MRRIVQTKAFKTDLKKVKHSGRYHIDNLLIVIDQLAQDQLLASKHKDHALTGNWNSHRECHIKPDWLLIYKLEDDLLILIRTGSHTALLD